MVLDGSKPPPFEASQFEPNVTDGTHAGARDQMKVEPTGCRSSISLVSYDVRVMITANDPALLGRLPEHFPPGWRPTDSAGVDELFSIFADVRTPGRRARPRNLLYRGPDLIATAPNIDQTLNQLESWLRLTVAVRARHRVFVHAGVVGWGGQALLLPGRSCSGKTTLVAALVRAGATYFSDEYAVLDAAGRVHAFPKPLSIRQHDGGGVQKCPVHSLGGRTAKRPLPVGLVVVTRYRPGVQWRPRKLSAAQGLFALLANTPTALTRSEDAVSTLKQVVTGAVTLRGGRPEADKLAPMLLEYLDNLPADVSAHGE